MPPDSTSGEIGTPPRPVRPRTIVIWAVAVGGVAALLLFAFFAVRGPGARTRPTVLSLLPPLESPEILAPAIAPDGSRVVFVARDSAGTSRLWLRPLDSPSARLLSRTEGAAYPFWSPDSRLIAFFGGSELKVIDPWDQSVRVIAPAPSGRGGSWNHDGVIVFAPGAQSPLHRVSASGGEARAVTRLDSQSGELAHRSPVFLPDGQRFLYRAMTGGGDRILAGALDASEPRIITDALRTSVQYARSGHLLFRRDGALVAQPFDPRRLVLGGEPTAVMGDLGEDEEEVGTAFSVSDSGVLVMTAGAPQQGMLTWIDRTGARRGVLGEQAEYVTVALSPDGTRVAADRRDPRSGQMEIWLIDATRGSASRFGAEGSNESDPIWSADGAWIAFARGRQHVFRRAVATGEEEALVTGEHRKYPTGWASDGQRLFFFANDPVTQGNVWALPLTPDRVPVLLVGGPAMEGEGSASPDGRWLAYDSDESGRYEVYVRDLSGGDQVWKISDAGGWSPKWRRDGRELFYQSEDRPAIMTVTISTRPKLEATPPQTLFETHDVIRGYDVSADGQRFLLNLGTKPDRASSALTVVVNWPALINPPR